MLLTVCSNAGSCTAVLCKDGRGMVWVSRSSHCICLLHIGWVLREHLLKSIGGFCGAGNALGSVTFTDCKLKHIPVAECIGSCRLQEKIHGVIFLCTNIALQAYCSKARFIFFFLQIRNVDTNQCLDNMGRKENEKVGIFNCHGMGGNQVGMTVRV